MEFFKLKHGDEVIQAERLTDVTARISIIPLGSNHCLDDIVSYDKENKIVASLVKKHNKAIVGYEVCLTDADKTKETLEGVLKYVEEEGFICKPALPGLILVAVPMGIPQANLDSIAEDCYYDITFKYD